MDQEQFFPEMKKRCSDVEEILKNFQNQNIKNEEIISEIISQEKINVINLQKHIEEVKVYIIFMGITSSGKSTFINSLLGTSLLPTKNIGCTKQFLFISYGEKLKIQDEDCPTICEGTTKLKDLEKKKNIKQIQIQYPSLFHKSLPTDLRDRIIFVDTPGININQLDQGSNLREFQNVIGENHMIQFWFSNYQNFDGDESKYYKLKQKLSDLKLTNLNEKSEFKDNFYFVLNKCDQVTQDEETDNKIIQINNIIGQTKLIYKISALNSLNQKLYPDGSEINQNTLQSNVYREYEDLRKSLHDQIKSNIITGFENEFEEIELISVILSDIFLMKRQLPIQSSDEGNLDKLRSTIQTQIQQFSELVISLKTLLLDNLKPVFQSQISATNNLFKRFKTQKVEIQLKDFGLKLVKLVMPFLFSLEIRTRSILRKVTNDILPQILNSNDLHKQFKEIFELMVDQRILSIERKYYQVFEKSLSRLLGIHITRVSKQFFFTKNNSINFPSKLSSNIIGLLGFFEVQRMNCTEELETDQFGEYLKKINQVLFLKIAHSVNKIWCENQEIEDSFNFLSKTIQEQLEITCAEYINCINHLLLLTKSLTNYQIQ